MEEIEYKLKKKNPILIAEATSKLLNIIRSKAKEKSGKYSDIPEFKFLKQKCDDVDPLINTTACQGMIALVEQGIVPLPSAFSEVITLMPFAKYFSGIINVVGTLLTIDLNVHIAENKQYHTPFKIKPPQHPIVTVLKQKKNVWHDVLHQMKLILHHEDEAVSSNGVELLKPALVYVLCVPSYLSNDCRKEIWDVLLSPEQPRIPFLLEVYTWFQCNSTCDIEDTASFFMKLCAYAIKKNDTLLSSALSPNLAALTHQVVLSGLDCRTYYSTLIQLLKISSQEAGSCVLMLLSETIQICPINSIQDILKCCMYLIEQKCCNTLSVAMLQSVLLPWLMFGSSITYDICQLMNNIFNIINDLEVWGSHTSRLLSNKFFSLLRSVDNNVTIASHLCILAEFWQMKPGSLEQWLERIMNAPHAFLEKLKIFFCGLLIHYEEEKVQVHILQLLLKMVKQNPEFSRFLIAVIFYKLTDEREPKMKIQLFRGFTEMAVLKENVTSVMYVLEMMKGVESLRPFTVHLYTELWKVESRCYPYLEKMLKETPKNSDSSWEHNISNAVAMHVICKTRPNVDSKFLVGLQANILSTCNGPSGSVASSLALDGLTELCKAGIVDIITTWKALAPKLNRDKRPVVIKSWCKFMATLPELHCPNQKYEKTVSEVVARLWAYVIQSDDIEIIKQAFAALSKFKLEQISLKDLPEDFRKGLKLPSAYAKTPVDAARRPEDVLPYVPSECWVQMLSSVKPFVLETAGSLLIHWMKIEVASFHFIVGITEPANYSNLPPHSICRGLLHFLKVTIEPEQIHVARECLRILSHPYDKLLPPVNWRFMEPFFSILQLQEYTIALAAKQSCASASACKLLDDFIQQLTPSRQTENEILHLFSSLGNLCKGIPPNVLKPFVQQSLVWAVEQATGSNSQNKEHGETIAKQLFSSVKQALKKEDIHDANRTLLSLCIEGLIEQFTVGTPLFDAYVDCVVELATKYLERMSSPSVWWEVTPDKLHVALEIRTALARRTDTETPLVWLNECIDATQNMPSEHTTMLKNIASVVMVCRDNESNCSWLLELMGHIQLLLISDKDTANTQQALVYLCDIFIVAVIIFSGYDCVTLSLDNITSSREVRLQLIPQALAHLVVQDKWNNVMSQVQKWLLCMQKSNVLSLLYRNAFRQAFVSLKVDKAFKESGFWIQYLDSHV